MYQPVQHDHGIEITLTPKRYFKKVPLGTMPIHQEILIDEYLKTRAVYRTCCGELFELRSTATSDAVLIDSPFNCSRAWADLLAPAISYYHKAVILRCASAFDSQNNRLILILGESGAGKTTLLNYICKTNRFFVPLGDDHLAIIPHGETLSVSTPIWDEFGKTPALHSGIYSCRMVLLNGKENTRSFSSLYQFLLSQTLCSAVSKEITPLLLSSIESLLSKATLFCFDRLNRLNFEKRLREVARVLH